MTPWQPHTIHRGQAPDSGITLEQLADGWIDMRPHIDHLSLLAKPAKTIVEFGVRGGVSTWALLRGMAADAELWSVDIENVRPWLPEAVRADPRFHFVLGNSIEAPLPEHADLVMIDSSHYFTQTVLELARAEKMGARVIALHDYLYDECQDTVRAAVDGFVGQGFGQQPAYRLVGVEPSRWGLAILEKL